MQTQSEDPNLNTSDSNNICIVYPLSNTEETLEWHVQEMLDSLKKPQHSEIIKHITSAC